jgi:hypothetical protein
MLMPLQTELVSRFDSDDLDGDRFVEAVPFELSPGTFVNDDARFCWKGHDLLHPIGVGRVFGNWL